MILVIFKPNFDDFSGFLMVKLWLILTICDFLIGKKSKKLEKK